MSKRAAGGRPPKYDEPSRPVTLTLPESTLERLQSIDPDRAHAIVKLTNRILPVEAGARPPVEVVRVADKTGLILVGPSRALRSIPFLQLVEIAPERFLLALKAGGSFHALEIALQDLLDDIPTRGAWETTLLKMLRENVRQLRKDEKVSTAEILFVHLDDDLAA